MMDTMTETNAPDAQPLPIRDESIRLGQALKLASLVDDGAMARDVITDGLGGIRLLGLLLDEPRWPRPAPPPEPVAAASRTCSLK